LHRKYGFGVCIKFTTLCFIYIFIHFLFFVFDTLKHLGTWFDVVIMHTVFTLFCMMTVRSEIDVWYCLELILLTYNLSRPIKNERSRFKLREMVCLFYGSRPCWIYTWPITYIICFFFPTVITYINCSCFAFSSTL
jgi:hypothetical protein